RLEPKIRPEQARKSLKLLEELGLIKKDAKGRYQQTQKTLATPAPIRGIAAIRYHQKMIEISKASITRVPARERNIGALTVALSSEKAAELMEKLYRVQMEILEEAD